NSVHSCTSQDPTRLDRWYLVFSLRDAATTEFYTLSLHDALPICRPNGGSVRVFGEQLDKLDEQSRSKVERRFGALFQRGALFSSDRKSTRLNSSHVKISYAVFCLKKKKVRHHI